MAEAVAEKTGKSSAKLWKRGEVKEQNLVEGDDWVIPVGVSIEWTATATPMRSRKVEGTLTGSGEQHLGAASLNASGYIIRDTGTTSAYTGNVILESTSTETAKVETGAKEIKSLQFKVSSGKYIQTETVKSSATIAIKGSSTWETAAQELATSGELNVEETSTFKCNGSTVKASSIAVGSTATLVDNAATVWEPTAVGGKLTGGGHTFNGTVKLLGKQTVGGANTFATLQINNRGALAGAGIKLKKGETQTVTELTTNGTLAEPARLESSVSGETAKLKVKEEQLESWLIVKDIAFETGVFYIPKPVEATANALGNSIVKPTENFTVAFEAKPSAALTFSATAAIGVKPAVTGKLVAATAAIVGVGASTNTQDKLLASTAAKVALSVSPKLTDQLLASFNATATTSISPQLSDKLAAAFAAHAGVTIQPNGHFKLVTTETGKRILILVLDE